MGFVELESERPEQCNLQTSRWHFGAESSIVLKFIALRVESRGDGPFFCSQHLILLRG